MKDSTELEEAAKPVKVQDIAKAEGLEDSAVQNMMDSFHPFMKSIKAIKEQAEELTVTDESQISQMIESRELRLQLVKSRNEADRTRKKLKDYSLKFGRAVQGVFHTLELSCRKIEDHLQANENFAEIREKERRAELSASRSLELSGLHEFVPAISDLGGMPEDDFQKILEGAKMLKQKSEDDQRIEEERQKEEKRKMDIFNVRRESILPLSDFTDFRPSMETTEEEFQEAINKAKDGKAKREAENERIRVELDKQKAEQKKREAEMEKQRQELEAEKIKAEKLRVEAELTKQKEADRIAIEEDNKKRAEEDLKSGDDIQTVKAIHERILQWSEVVQSLEFKSKKGQKFHGDLIETFGGMDQFCEKFKLKA